MAIPVCIVALLPTRDSLPIHAKAERWWQPQPQNASSGDRVSSTGSQ
jgi:hypothetical protein